jgi:hypothetical protein
MYIVGDTYGLDLLHGCVMVCYTEHGDEHKNTMRQYLEG